MPGAIEDLQQEVKDRSAELKRAATQFESDMLTALEEVKSNIILSAVEGLASQIRGLEQRMASFEARLPEEEP